MTETNAMSVDKEEKKTVTVSWKKLTDGIGLVFAGTLTMLEALDGEDGQGYHGWIQQEQFQPG